MLLKCCTQYASKNSAVATGLEKVRFHSNPKEGQCQRISNCGTIGLISYASKVMLKILQARLQQYAIWKLPGIQAGFRKGRGTRGQTVNICWIIEKSREFQKMSTSSSLTTQKTLTMLLLLSRFSRVRLCATPETAAHQAPLSLGFSRQEHWSGLSFPSPGHKVLTVKFVVLAIFYNKILGQ